MSEPLDEMRNTTWRLFLVTQVQVIEQIQKKLSAAKLPPLEWYDVLWALKKAPDWRLRLSELADQVLLSRSNLTRLLDRLEKNKLVQRKPCSTDRRGTFAVLTEAGAVMQETMWITYSDGIAEYFGDRLSDDEVQTLQQAFRKILLTH
ncbi:MAG: MarR family transcriptional regulator [Elainellaceae cyanobacterium]